MTDQERAAYTPPIQDAPLSFDARQPVRGARPVPLTLIISVLVLAGLVAAIFVFYRSGVRQAGQAPGMVGEPVTDMRGAAPPEAQPQDPAAGLEIYKAEAATDPMAAAPPQFTSPPEQPQARPAPVPVVVTPPTIPRTTTQPVAAPMKPALPATVPAVAAPKVAPAPVQKAAAPPPTPAPKVVAATGGAVVQVGAVTSPALADRTWNEAVSAAPGLGAGKGKSVERIERDGTVLYRTGVTGFASRDEATAFCNRIKAAGKSCFVR